MTSELVKRFSHPNYWFNHASDLRAAAGAVWFAMGEQNEQVRESLGLDVGFSMNVASRPVYHLLCGLALEVLLKALLVDRGEEPPATHDLIRLAGLAGIDLDTGEHALLRYYSTTIAWGGRYPLPTKPTDEKLESYWVSAVEVLTRPREMAPGSSLKVRTPSDDDRWERFHALYMRIKSKRQRSS